MVIFQIGPKEKTKAVEKMRLSQMSVFRSRCLLEQNNSTKTRLSCEHRCNFRCRFSSPKLLLGEEKGIIFPSERSENRK